MLGSYKPSEIGYSVAEYELAGRARSYQLPGEAASDGPWMARSAASARYRTRIVVLRPAEAKTFNGTVVVEWFNVSGGLDVPVDWVSLHREMVREGYAYVGVSAQMVGVEGGPNLGRGTSAPLKTAHPERYGQLSHPGDAFSYDIYSDVARLLRGKQRSEILGGLVSSRIIGVGESQSAFFLTTYVNAVDPLARVYDGFLIHSRTGMASQLNGTGIIGAPPELLRTPIKLRDDLRVPTIQVHTETDVIGFANTIGFHAARQPDSSKLRTWEIAGTAHADNYLFSVGVMDSGLLPLEKLATAWAPMDSVQGLKLPQPMNNAPQHHYVAQAALHRLDEWLRTGKAPPTASPLQLTGGDPPAFVADDRGIARGGVRTAWVDVPIATLSGLGAIPEMPLIGTTRVFDTDRLRRLYPGGLDDYLRQFTTGLDRDIDAGFILPADREEIIELARLGYPGNA
jgi:hypothetical protein